MSSVRSTDVLPMTPTQTAALRSPSAGRPAPRRPAGSQAGRSGDVDGLRALAALGVVVFHVTVLGGFAARNPLGAWTARMDVGVTIFFVLSGYLLYRPMVTARVQGRPAPSLGGYFRRRLVRILPAYWVALTVLAVALPNTVRDVFSSRWWVYYGLLQSWSADTVIKGVGVAWSLSVEMAFYLLLPLLSLLAAAALRGRSNSRQLTLELVAIGASAALAVGLRAVAAATAPLSSYPNTLPGCWAWFCGGLALAVLSAHSGTRAPRERPWVVRNAAAHPWLWWTAAFGLLTVTAFGLGLPRGLSLGDPATDLQRLAQHVANLAIALLVVAPVALADPAILSTRRRILASRPMVVLGTISYGIFLWHLPVTYWLVARRSDEGALLLVVLGVSCLAATCSWLTVERPLLEAVRRHADDRPDRGLSPATAAVEPAP